MCSGHLNFSPASGPVDTVVTLNGSGFTGSNLEDGSRFPSGTASRCLRVSSIAGPRQRAGLLLVRGRTSNVAVQRQITRRKHRQRCPQVTNAFLVCVGA